MARRRRSRRSRGLGDCACSGALAGLDGRIQVPLRLPGAPVRIEGRPRRVRLPGDGGGPPPLWKWLAALGAAAMAYTLWRKKKRL